MTHFGDTDSELGSKAAEGAGIPEERVVHDEEGIKNGGILMGVSPRSDDDAAHIGRSARRGGRRGRHGWAWRGGDGR